MKCEKKANDSIHCGVKSCEYHCGNKEYCSLQSINVQPCTSCGDGCASDESFCGSYRAKR